MLTPQPLQELERAGAELDVEKKARAQEVAALHKEVDRLQDKCVEAGAVFLFCIHPTKTTRKKYAHVDCLALCAYAMEKQEKNKSARACVCRVFLEM